VLGHSQEVVINVTCINRAGDTRAEGRGAETAGAEKVGHGAAGRGLERIW
jgi:hypothetical protein